MDCLVSIITPVLNRATMLPDALSSLGAQGGVSLEHIVVDGGSTDGSRDVAARSGAVVIEAPGSSIYEALNIGLARARGDLVALLNSDDMLAPGALAAARHAFNNDPDLDLLRGRAATQELRDGVWTTIDRGRHQGGPPTLRRILLDASNINACVFKAALVKRVGPFNTAYPIAADRHWLARVLVSDANIAALDQTLYIYRRHALSLTIGERKPATAQWVREHLAFSTSMLRNEHLGQADRSALLAFHAKEIVHLAALHASGGAPLSALAALGRGFSTDLMWPFHAVGPLARIAARRAHLGFG